MQWWNRHGFIVPIHNCSAQSTITSIYNSTDRSAVCIYIYVSPANEQVSCWPFRNLEFSWRLSGMGLGQCQYEAFVLFCNCLYVKSRFENTGVTWHETPGVATIWKYRSRDMHRVCGLQGAEIQSYLMPCIWSCTCATPETYRQMEIYYMTKSLCAEIGLQIIYLLCR